MPSKSCSLIVSTYNRPDALKRCLESVMVQSILPGEIIVADDGSGFDTRFFVEEFKNQSTVPVVHIWQPDEGYQLAKIRNKAFNAASTEYLIQIDGDLILHRHFIKDHTRIAKPGVFVSGARIHMDEILTKKVLSGIIAFHDIPKESPHLSKKHNGFYSEFLSRMNYMLQTGKHNYKYVLGCNMAFWKKDLEKVNGYNEGFKGWGKEDNDLAVRLINAGVQLRFIKYGAIIYHLAHPVADLSFMPANEQVLEKSLREKITYVPDGMNHPPSPPKGGNINSPL
jgi:glycosyltransferase involved in cell wall biosynthesis